MCLVCSITPFDVLHADVLGHLRLCASTAADAHLLTGIAAASEYKYLNLVTSNEQQTEGDGQPQSANMIIPHLLQERSDARDSRKARTPEGRRDQKSSHVRGQRSRQERLSLQPKQPDHMDSQKKVLAEGTRAGRDQTALDATSGGLQDTIGDLPQIQGDARADGSGSVGAAAATGGDHEGASDDYEDEGEGGDDAGSGAVSVKPSAGKRVTGEDFQQVAELHLSDILKGKLRHSGGNLPAVCGRDVFLHEEACCRMPSAHERGRCCFPNRRASI